MDDFVTGPVSLTGAVYVNCRAPALQRQLSCPKTLQLPPRCVGSMNGSVLEVDLPFTEHKPIPFFLIIMSLFNRNMK